MSQRESQRAGESQREPERARERTRERTTESHKDSLWLSLTFFGSPWLSLWLTLALTGSLWLTLALSGSLSGSLWPKIPCVPKFTLLSSNLAFGEQETIFRRMDGGWEVAFWHLSDNSAHRYHDDQN